MDQPVSRPSCLWMLTLYSVNSRPGPSPTVVYNVLKASGREEALRLSRENANIGLLLHGSPIHEHDTLGFTQQFRRAHPGAPVLQVLWSLEGFDEICLRWTNLLSTTTRSKRYRKLYRQSEDELVGR